MIISIEKKWLVEVISWIFSFIACLLLLIPILFSIQYYPFLTINVISILVALHYTRLIFLKPFIPFGNSILFMLIVIFSAIPITFLLIENLFTVQGYFDEIGIYNFLKTLPEDKVLSISNYIKYELTFFSIWAIMASAISPFVMIKSIWVNYKNKNLKSTESFRGIR